jgi:hypothetical protein
VSRRTIAAVVLSLGLLAGCGGQEDLSVEAEQALTQDVAAITDAARVGDAARLQELVVQLRRHVEQFEDSGDVSESRAAEILAAAARVATDVGPPAPEVVVSVVPAAPPEPAEGEGKGDDDDKDDGKGSEDKGKSDDGKDEGKGD